MLTVSPTLSSNGTGRSGDGGSTLPACLSVAMARDQEPPTVLAIHRFSGRQWFRAVKAQPRGTVATSSPIVSASVMASSSVSMRPLSQARSKGAVHKAARVSALMRSAWSPCAIRPVPNDSRAASIAPRSRAARSGSSHARATPASPAAAPRAARSSPPWRAAAILEAKRRAASSRSPCLRAA
jgi:hypothetical protein